MVFTSGEENYLSRNGKQVVICGGYKMQNNILSVYNKHVWNYRINFFKNIRPQITEKFHI